MQQEDSAAIPLFPSAEGARLPWGNLPGSLRTALEERLGAPVVQAIDRPGGFSPGAAARLLLADGRRVFVKAVSASANPDSPEMHRREALIAAGLPGRAPVPRFLFVHDDGEWVALAFEDVDGRHPRLPWRPHELERVLDAVTELASSLTPSPVDTAPIGRQFADLFRGWRTLFEAGDEALAGLHPWARRQLPGLAALEAGWQDAASGDTLLHADLRADNILLTREGVVFVDWPHACIGAGWVDLLALVPSVAMQHGPKPWTLFDGHPLSRMALAEDVDAVLAALAGCFVWRGSLPAPPGLPTLRAFQRAQGHEALAWLRHRLGEG